MVLYLIKLMIKNKLFLISTITLSNFFYKTIKKTIHNKKITVKHFLIYANYIKYLNKYISVKSRTLFTLL